MKRYNCTIEPSDVMGVETSMCEGGGCFIEIRNGEDRSSPSKADVALSRKDTKRLIKQLKCIRKATK